MLGFSIFAGQGAYVIFQNMKNSVIRLLISLLIIGSPLVIFLPAFEGKLISPAMKIAIPTDYFSLFHWLNTQDHDKRVALLPAGNMWNWINYRWGYQGAGFLQFGIPQPILDRDYDRWNNTNENYYWELSRAISTKDIKELENVFQKYDVSFILLDLSVISRENDRSLSTTDLVLMLETSSIFKHANQFGNILVYENVHSSPSIRTTNTLPAINPYTWTDNDVAYRQIGDYSTSSTANFTYPFRSLFTKRAVDEREFSITDVLDKKIYRYLKRRPVLCSYQKQSNHAEC